MINIRDLTEDDIAELYPDLPPEDREKAAYNLTEYFRIAARIYARLESEGKIPKMLIRAAEKRQRREKRLKKRRLL
jgi:hypothetical protein